MTTTNVIRGHKIVTTDYRSIRDLGDDHFVVGSTHHVDGPPVLGSHGFHFGSTPLVCLTTTYQLGQPMRVLVVEADAADTVASPCGTRFAASTLRIVDEVADVDAVLTGTVDVTTTQEGVVLNQRSLSFLAGRLHQTSDDNPARVSRVRGSTWWRWYRNGGYGRCDGDATLPVSGMLYDDGRRRFEWHDASGRLSRGDGKAPSVLTAGDDVVKAVWFGDAILSSVTHYQASGVIEVAYGHDKRATLVVHRNSSSSSPRATVNLALELGVDASGTTVVVTNVDANNDAVRYFSDPTRLSFGYWLDVLERQRPPVDVIDAVLAAEQKTVKSS
jgi:hypothetical protein